jgi:hypothetical protein
MNGCLEGFKSLPVDTANEAARCILDKKSMKATGDYMEAAAKAAR